MATLSIATGNVMRTRATERWKSIGPSLQIEKGFQWSNSNFRVRNFRRGDAQRKKNFENEGAASRGLAEGDQSHRL